MAPLSVIVAGFAGFAAGYAVSSYELHRVRSRIGPTWYDWMTAPYVGGRRWWLAKPITVIVCFFVIGSFFLPGWVRAGILAALVGVCAPFWSEGVHRHAFAEEDDAPDEENEPDD